MVAKKKKVRKKKRRKAFGYSRQLSFLKGTVSNGEILWVFFLLISSNTQIGCSIVTI